MSNRLSELERMLAVIQREIAVEKAAAWRMANLRDDVADLLDKHPPAVAEILRETSFEYDVPVADIVSESRARISTEPRQVTCFLLRDLGLSYSRIANVVRRDHSTAIHSVKQVRSNPELLHRAGRIHGRLGAPRLSEVS